MIYKIRIVEKLERTVSCYASDENEAVDKVIEKYRNEEIVLTAEDYTSTEFEIVL